MLHWFDSFRPLLPMKRWGQIATGSLPENDLVPAIWQMLHESVFPKHTVKELPKRLQYFMQDKVFLAASDERY